MVHSICPDPNTTLPSSLQDLLPSLLFPRVKDLLFHSPFVRGFRGFRCDSPGSDLERPGQEFDKPLRNVLPVPPLAARFLRREDDNTIRVDDRSQFSDDPVLLRLSQARRVSDIKQELDACRHFIDVLPAGPTASGEAEVDLRGRYCYRR